MATTLTGTGITFADSSTQTAAASGGGGGTEADFTASGALADGDLVVLKADGTVEVVAETTATTTTNGAENVFRSGSSSYESNATSHDATGNYYCVKFDPHNAKKFAMVYLDVTTSTATGVVGNISGTTITFGTSVAFNTNCDHLDLAWDPVQTNIFVVAYTVGNYTAQAQACSVSGTTITKGTAVAYRTDNGQHTKIIFNPHAASNHAGQHVIVSSVPVGRAYLGHCTSSLVLSYSGPTFTPINTSWYYSNCTYYDGCWDPNSNSTEFLLTYLPGNTGQANPLVIKGKVIGDASVSFNYNMTDIPGHDTAYMQLRYFPGSSSDDFVCCFSDVNNSNYGSWLIGDSSGNTPSLGSSSVFHSGACTHINFEFDKSGTNKFVVTYINENGKGAMRAGTYSGTTLTFGSESIFHNADTDFLASAYDPSTAGKMISLYRDDGSSGNGTAMGHDVALTTTTVNIEADNFVGVAQGATANGQSATVALRGGVVSNLTGLTVGSEYYVKKDGTLSTTPGSPKVPFGKALSATTALIEAKPIGSAGTWQEISSQTISSSISSVTFSSLDLSSYQQVRLEIYDVDKNNNLYTYLELSNDAFSTYETWLKNGTAWFDNTNTNYEMVYGGTRGGGNGQYFYVNSHNGQNISKGLSGYMDFVVNREEVLMNGMGMTYDDGAANILWSGHCDCTTFTDLRLEAYSGNFTSGTFRLLGMV